MDSTEMESTRCHLLKLPAELRNHKWTLAVGAYARGRRPRSVWWIDELSKDGELKQPSLTQVCRQIRTETLPIFYSRTSFVIDHIGTESCRAWIGWLPAISEQAAFIRKLEAVGLLQARSRPRRYIGHELWRARFRIDAKGRIRCSVSTKESFKHSENADIAADLESTIDKVLENRKETVAGGVDWHDWLEMLWAFDQIIFYRVWGKPKRLVSKKLPLNTKAKC